MQGAISEALQALSGSPVIQAILAAVCTFVLEDPTTLGCALLVADGRMLYLTALVGLTLGIGLGDWGLYAAGRYLSPWLVRRGLVSRDRLDRIGDWFEENMFTAVMVSRFVPGLRLPANLAAGMTHAALRVYLPAALFASFVWTFLALTLISNVGEAVLPLLGALKWPIGIGLILALIYIQRRTYLRMRSDPESKTAEEAPASFFEFWHPVLFYAPVAVYYLLLAIRHRSLTLPTVANPAIYSGGMIRESKCAILDIVPEEHRRWVAPYIAFAPSSPDLSPDAALDEAAAALDRAGIALPIVAKPDLGQRGAGVRLIHTEDELRAYLEAFPKEATICLQALAPGPHEVGIMYHRFPSDERGHVTSVTWKEFPAVRGDGATPLRELIEQHERARFMRDVFFERHAKQLDRILEPGEEFPLVFAGNHAQGCVFRDGMHILTPALAARMDEIARALPDFCFGRFDLRFSDLEALQKGEGFTIVEINGAAAESTHIWDPDGTLSDAYFTLFRQFRVLFKIGAMHRRRGHKPLSPVQFLKDVVLYHRVARKYPLAH